MPFDPEYATDPSEGKLNDHGRRAARPLSRLPRSRGAARSPGLSRLDAARGFRPCLPAHRLHCLRRRLRTARDLSVPPLVRDGATRRCAPPQLRRRPAPFRDRPTRVRAARVPGRQPRLVRPHADRPCSRLLPLVRRSSSLCARSRRSAVAGSRSPSNGSTSAIRSPGPVLACIRMPTAWCALAMTASACRTAPTSALRSAPRCGS